MFLNSYPFAGLASVYFMLPRFEGDNGDFELLTRRDEVQSQWESWDELASGHRSKSYRFKISRFSGWKDRYGLLAQTK